MTAMSETAKQHAATAAIERLAPQLSPDAVVGVGTGSTANAFIDQLAAIRHTFDCAVASSVASSERLQGHGIPVRDLNSVDRLHAYIDGADEIDPARRMVKGAGGAHTREKIVACAADTFLCIVDDSKLVAHLGNVPVPVEVLPMARGMVARHIIGLGGEPVWRQGFVTDNGNLILDIHGLPLDDPAAMERTLNELTGVVDCGLFALRPADHICVGTADGHRCIDTFPADQP